MKKLLFTLLSAVALFSSCSSDNDTFIDNGLDNNSTEKKYTVNFDIKSAGFEVDKTPMRLSTSTYWYLHVIVYKESGELYSDTLLSNKDIQDDLLEDGSYPFSINLPKGKYHLAFIHNPMSFRVTETIQGNMLDKWALQPSNFYTDIEKADGMLASSEFSSGSNKNNYFNTLDVDVNDTSSVNLLKSVELDPMWSNVSITFDLTNTDIPTNAQFMRVDMKPAYVGYKLANGLACINTESHNMNQTNYGYIHIDKTLGSYSTNLSVSKTEIENNNMVLVVYIGTMLNSNDVAMFEIDLKTQVENGFNYHVKGKLPNFINTERADMEISYIPFNEEGINVPFR